MNEKMNYIKFLFYRAYENNMHKYFSILYKQYNNNGEFSFLSNMDKRSSSAIRVYGFLCSFANSDMVRDSFELLKTCVKSDIALRKTYYRVNEGYIEDNNPNLLNALMQIEQSASAFIVALLKFKNACNIDDASFDSIIEEALSDLQEISDEYNYNDDRSISVYQFAELAMIKNLIPKLTAIKENSYTLT